MIKKYKNKIMELDVPNKNNHIYGSEIIESMLATQVYPIMGYIGMPPLNDQFLDNVSHTIESLYIENGILYADICILDTPNGLILHDMIDNVLFRTAGYANFTKEDDNLIVNNFELISINAVNKEDAA